jgi:hypothetical protein
MVLGRWYWANVEFALSSASVLSVRFLCDRWHGSQDSTLSSPTTPMWRYMIAMNMKFFNTKSSAGCYW